MPFDVNNNGNGSGPSSPTVPSLSGKEGQTGSQIWAIGGGKGGSGKSLITSNLGICLSRTGKEVLLVDADLGGANLHSCLGIPYPNVTLSDFIRKKVIDIKAVTIDTGMPNLHLISGAEDYLEVANTNYAQKIRLLRQLITLDTEYILLDLGAGTAFNTLDFFLIANNGIIIVTPEPTSIENAYRFIKSVFFRRLKRMINNYGVREIIAKMMDRKNELGIKTPIELINYIEAVDKDIGQRFKEMIKKFRPKLIINSVRTKGDINTGFSIKSACLKYFGINVSYVGYVEYDECVWQSVRRRRALLLEYPNSRPAKCIEKIAKNIIMNKEIEEEHI
ncbi:MAG: P-loop NTPase [Nitrospirae bacterium]|nr:P-loop NTPase [Nitrospirota bacterium]